ncbi:hypothetical protein HPB50_004948 [Hyalomma asiaticum]|uniref:Uncharacterized protein n=1 Tax=Hyalomma asiaticum TaxID=266040 RepID=A0ACB7RWX5_HYAAI|nr:hypothetical protein HPB50_004948 [Hyalomma asiaticum]
MQWSTEPKMCGTTTSALVTSKVVDIDQNLHVSVVVMGRRISTDEFQINDDIATIEDVKTFLQSLHEMPICGGGPKTSVYPLAHQESATVDARNHWRHKKCPVLLPANNSTCKWCSSMSDTLRIRQKRKKIATKSSSERHGILVFDEIQVRKEMRVNTKTMTYAGFADFGEAARSSDELADHGLVFTFRAFGDSYSQPIAVFASKGPTRGTVLAQLVLKAILLLEDAGVFVDAIVCDGATTNRAMWKQFSMCTGLTFEAQLGPGPMLMKGGPGWPGGILRAA